MTLTYSPKVFLPLTNLCRNSCDYCAFRQKPAESWTMSPEEVEGVLGDGAAMGCTEALFCLGDTPETSFASYRALLAGWGFESTVDYLLWGGEVALRAGLLPHTNAGILSGGDMERLARVNVSLGLMLESVSERLCEPGGPHAAAPDKRPSVRLAMLEQAGVLGIPFTTGVLVGFGETEEELLATLDAIVELHARHGHIQELIVQNFVPHSGTRMEEHPPCSLERLTRAIRQARRRLPPEVSVQAPPNLNPGTTADLIEAGINDFGGISPLTPDYINREQAWPHLDTLRAQVEALGHRLEPRLPVYPGWVSWLPEELQARCA